MGEVSCCHGVGREEGAEVSELFGLSALRELRDRSLTAGEPSSRASAQPDMSHWRCICDGRERGGACGDEKWADKGERSRMDEVVKGESGVGERGDGG